MPTRQKEKNEGPVELSLAVAATNTIRDRILDLSLQPGAQLDETMLRNELGISRTPAREALNRLTTEGLIEMHRNRGFFVRPLDLSDLTQFFEAYLVSERSSAYYCRLAQPHLVKDLESIQDNHHRAVSNQMFLEISRYNAAFHIRIAEATENEYLIGFASRLHNMARRLAYYVYLRESGEQQAFQNRQRIIVDEHRAIIEAIRNKDRDRLLATITNHAELFRRRIGAFIEGKGKPVFMLT
ncbi:GntR family transcriptional regulator [Mesorhizobium sp. NZP2077]|uniref:GntR family transcriptional regulator n=1 Tax=Mesorhizobium sp. NZP2077 TaxID=2483404 RepID=UPI001555DBF2|nr:GntR family transcriptional regulator [Mesorhizobium sp. NZP2077]QKD19625.1 GntR family transcriptional regulator [Mesorhizobium sp. NZP2077]